MVENFANEISNSSFEISHSNVDFNQKIDFAEVGSNKSQTTDFNKRIDFFTPKLGGSYEEVRNDVKSGIENGTIEKRQYEVHHMPANDSYNLDTTLDYSEMPCIRMETADHRKTGSCGCSEEANAYREKQYEHMVNGDFDKALQMDIDDIKSKFGDKYDDAISEMNSYIDKMKHEGRI